MRRIGAILAMAASVAIARAQPSPPDNASDTAAPVEPPTPADDVETPPVKPSRPGPAPIVLPPPPPAPPTAADLYPRAVADRPLLMSRGMDRIDFALQFRTKLITTTDAMGNITTDRSELGDGANLALLYAHSFGKVEIEAFLGPLSHIAVAVQPSRHPLVVSAVIGGRKTTSVADDAVYLVFERIGAAYKLVHLPKQFSLIASAGITTTQQDNGQPDGDAKELFGMVAIGATAQLSETVAMTAAVSTSLLAYSSYHAPDRATLEAGSQLIYAAGRWDLYMEAAADDVTRIARPFLGFGIVRRW